METLSSRDKKVLALMGEGHRDIDICLKLGMSPESLERAVKRIRERAELMADTPGIQYERALRKLAEADRNSLEARFRALMDASMYAILVVEGRSGVIRQANEGAAHLFGYTVGALTGMLVENLVPLEQRSIHKAYRVGFLASVRKREMGYHPPIQALRGDGGTVEIAIALTATTANDDVMVLCTEFEKWTRSEGERVENLPVRRNP